LDNVVGAKAVELGFRFEHDAVAEDRCGDGFDVVGSDVVAAGEGGYGFAGME